MKLTPNSIACRCIRKLTKSLKLLRIKTKVRSYENVRIKKREEKKKLTMLETLAYRGALLFL